MKRESSLLRRNISVVLTIFLLLSISCAKSSNLAGYSELATNTQINRVAILPFEPGDDFAHQAEGLTLFHLKNMSRIDYIPSESLITFLDIQYLYPSKLNERTVNTLCTAFGIDILLCGKTISRSKYNQWSKKYEYNYDLEIRLLDPKGNVVSKYFLENQKGKLQDGTKAICLKICEDMRWSAKLEESNDIFDLNQ